VPTLLARASTGDDSGQGLRVGTTRGDEPRLVVESGVVPPHSI
jgi:hypothetical protein